MMQRLWFAIIIISGITIPNAFAAPGSQCFEQLPTGSSNDLCGLLSTNMTTVFQAFRMPLETQIPGFSLVILWGGLIGILWFKTENIMLISIVGIVVAATITGLDTSARGYGYLLVGVSFGLLLFQLLRQRISLYS